MGSSSSNSPNYLVRESRRAKHVRLKISLLGEVEVVVPVGFDRTCLPDLLHEKRTWITQTVQQLKAERQSVSDCLQDSLPEEIHLRACNQYWTISYTPTLETRIRIVPIADHHLMVFRCIRDQESCRQALREWLRHQAIAQLVPWLQQVSQAVDLPFRRASVRGQKTRWASCSSQQTISLNYKLLFLPPDLVHYVFIHELCHLLQMDHSPAFWAFVEEREPNYRQLDAELRKAWRYVPIWVERSPQTKP